MELHRISPKTLTKPSIISHDLCVRGFMWKKLFNTETYKELFAIHHGTVKDFWFGSNINWKRYGMKYIDFDGVIDRFAALKTRRKILIEV